MKRLIFLSAAGLVALAEVLTLIFPSLVLDLIDLMPASLPTPPKGFDVRREQVEHGRVETVEYDSQAAGCTRKMRVYTPPRFAQDKRYPVLYLLHGSLGDETSWVQDGRADAILDNLYADKKLIPMIVVMPNGYINGRLDLDLFERDLLGDVIPYVEQHFPAQPDREHRALAGVSAGANQALGIGLAHPDAFAFIGVFIGGLLDHAQFEQKHPDALHSLGTDRKPKLLWLASGTKDVFYEDCQDTLRFLDKHKVHYVYVEGKGFHDWETTRNDLFVFAPLVFHDMD